jgi:hypothetical protein
MLINGHSPPAGQGKHPQAMNIDMMLAIDNYHNQPVLEMTNTNKRAALAQAQAQQSAAA